MKNTTNTSTTTAPVAKPINSGGLNLNRIYTATGKLARATHNAARHKSLNGLTVKAALATRVVNATDIKYDLAKGFITLKKPPKK